MIKILEKLVIEDDKEVLEKAAKYSPTDMVEGIILDTRRLYLNRYHDLRVVSRVGVGTDNIDLDECKARGIKVYITPCRELTDAVAEFTLYLALALLRKNSRGRNLVGMTVGILGYGRIGSAVHELFHSLSCDVMRYDIDASVDYGLEPKEQVLSCSRIVTIHSSGNEQVIGKEELEQMMDDSYLINTARAGCVDEYAVLDALRSKKLAGFATDVNELAGRFKLYNTVVTPHIASSTVEARTAMERMAVKNLIKGLKSERNRS